MKTLTQSFSLALFSLLFVLAAFTMPDWLPADVYLRLDPLLGVSAILAGREWIPRVMWSLIVIGATLAVGRFFCGYLCPLGWGSISWISPSLPKAPGFGREGLV